jgi:hypothetical protein
MLTMNDIIKYKENKNFNYLVIKSAHGDYYGFNLKVKKERTYAMKIVSPDECDDFMVVGWKVAKKLLNGITTPIAGLILYRERKRMRRKSRQTRKMTKRREKRRKQ